jgi:hypothetical protein
MLAAARPTARVGPTLAGLHLTALASELGFGHLINLIQA